jgi:hypothetical protein
MKTKDSLRIFRSPAPNSTDPQTCRVKILDDLGSIAGRVELMISAGAQRYSAIGRVIDITSVHENKRLT